MWGTAILAVGRATIIGSDADGKTRLTRCKVVENSAKNSFFN